MFLRPNLYTSYEEETQMLPTYTKKVLAGIAIVVLFLIPFDVPLITAPTDLPLLRNIPVISNGIPPLRFLGDTSWLRVMDEALIFAIAALGLNILTGMAGQVSLGHAFFMGAGAYTGAVLGGVATSSVWGWNLPIWIWLPGAGVGAAIVGIIVSPVAVKLRGLYLAIVTLGLVFIGIGGAYVVSAAFSLLSFVLYVRCPPGSAPRATSKASPFAEIVDGVRYVAARPHLRRLVLSSFVIIMFGFNYVAFIPALVKGEFGLGDGWVGIIMSASSIGAVAVALPLASRADGAGVWKLMVVSGLVFGTGVIALGLSPLFGVGVLVVAFIGAGTTGYQSLSNSIALNMTGDTHQGRVQSLMMLSFAGFGIAAAPLGLLAEAIGLRSAIGVMGAVTLTTVIGYGLLERHVALEIEEGVPLGEVAVAEVATT